MRCDVVMLWCCDVVMLWCCDVVMLWCCDVVMTGPHLVNQQSVVRVERCWEPVFSLVLVLQKHGQGHLQVWFGRSRAHFSPENRYLSLTTAHRLTTCIVVRCRNNTCFWTRPPCPTDCLCVTSPHLCSSSPAPSQLPSQSSSLSSLPLRSSSCWLPSRRQWPLDVVVTRVVPSHWSVHPLVKTWWLSHQWH